MIWPEMSIEHWSLLISIGAILISMFTWYRTDKRDRDRRADEIRERDSASFITKTGPVKTERSRSYASYINFENTGCGTAKVYQILIDGSPSPDIRKKKQERKAEYIEVAPKGGILKIEVPRSDTTPSPKEAEIYWDDDYKKANKETFQLTF
ncbi:MAG: hypothetical protein WEA36_10765 [Balneolaceae bacterium]